MKRETTKRRKLELNKLRLRQLTTEELGRAAGANNPPPNDSFDCGSFMMCSKSG
jgi:hypothetical protein